ncbi:MAG TPA: hypothetical protein VGP72_07600 [Planctomycetota bacterium]|jgi:hypothetical protein
MRTSLFASIALLAGTIFLVGCGDAPSSNPKATTAAPAAKLPEGLILSAAPAGAVSIKDAMKNAKAGDTIVIRGRIGGSKEETFLPDRAVFTIVDEALPTCDQNPADSCPQPWDYCCEPKDKLAENTASIRVNDPATGKTLKQPLKGQAKLSELNTVVVQGKVDERPSPNALTVIATGIFVEKEVQRKGK